MSDDRPRLRRLLRCVVLGIATTLLISSVCVFLPRWYRGAAIFTTSERECDNPWIMRHFSWMRARGIGVDVECVHWAGLASELPRGITPVTYSRDVFQPDWVRAHAAPPGGPATRHAVTAVVFLLIGLVVSVALAAAAPAVLAPMAVSGTVYPERRPRSEWRDTYVFFARGFANQQVAVAAVRVRPYLVETPARERPSLPSWAPWPDDLEIGETRLFVGSGWPFRCMTAQCVEYEPRWGIPQVRWGRPLTGVRNTIQPEWRDALVLSDQTVGGPFTARVVPCRIRWLPALADAAITGALLFIAWRALVGLRRRMRDHVR